MKREELPGFVRELPITILTLALVLTVFWPLYRCYRKKAEENRARARDAQEMTITDEIVEDAPGYVDKPGINEDSDSPSD